MKSTARRESAEQWFLGHRDEVRGGGCGAAALQGFLLFMPFAYACQVVTGTNRLVPFVSLPVILAILLSRRTIRLAVGARLRRRPALGRCGGWPVAARGARLERRP